MLTSPRARTVLVVSLMILAVFLANGIIAFTNLRRMHRNRELVDHSHQVLATLQSLRSQMLDAETGMRGYVITSDRNFLAPHAATIQAIPRTLDRLEALVKDSAQQTQAMLDLREAVDASRAQIDRLVKLKTNGQEDEALATIRSGRGKQLMDGVRASLRSMEELERETLSFRDRDSSNAYITAVATGVITAGVGIAMTCIAFFVIAREIKRHDHAALELRRANDFLEQRVSERTTELSQANSLMRQEIDERRRAEERVRLFAEELQRSNRELEQFASVASHDLQEPLRKIQAFGDRLRARFREELGEQGQDYIDRMLSSAQRMRTLIDDLLDFSRVTTKAQPFANVDLAQVVQEIVVDLETRIHQSGGKVEVGPLPIVRASPLQMRQLFLNLIGNALKFHRREVPPDVRIWAERIDSDARQHAPSTDTALQCRIIVEDNGIGFEPEYAERIFDLFQRLHGKDEYEGTGIGLAICRKIVDRHNGHIAAHSTPGSGTRFVITLPVERFAEGVAHVAS